MYYAHHVYGLKIHSFVLMPNHFHLIARISTHPIGKVMCEFMKNNSKEINLTCGRINQNWGGRHYKCEIQNYHYFLNVYKYVYQNPQRARLSSYAEEWKFSTLNGLTGLNKITIPVEQDTILFSPDFSEKELNWINKPIDKEHYQSMKLALEKRIFKLPRIKTSKNPIETILI